ncbi:MAG: methyl-accepting chemotaxis protein [Anaerovibrio sp.]|uniref:methyl-accepting chemotaxis protein n=1 Tax=Anaerovibrio sp. TaxID=1872532 RepID=UPI0025ED1644|nr:methyl-accepting chemotaxis protein [Anaerovibrio sp.]MCR5176504.1 methyl-accepting chemotaxis protein [Anaerovibrio sp.]
MSNLKVTFKILILVVISAIGMLFVGYRGYYSIDNAAQELNFLYERELQCVNLLGEATETMRTIQVRSMQAIADPSRADEVLSTQAKDIQNFDEALTAYSEKIKDKPESVAKLEEVKKSWGKFKVSLPAVIKAVKAGGSQAGTDEYNRAGKHDTVVLRDQLKALCNDAIEEAAAVNEANKEASSSAIRVMLISSLACLILLLVVSYVIVKAIKEPLSDMIATCYKLKSGDFVLSKYISQRGDEFGDVQRALADMSKSVNGFLKEVSNSAEQIAAASEELTASSMQSADASVSVAQSVTGAADIVAGQQHAVDKGNEEVGRIRESVSDISREAAEVADNSRQAATRATAGTDEVNLSVQQIHTLRESSQYTSELVDKLGARSQEIGAIVDTISDLAGQTNLLALNAAIEAARAGEQGRGFAVVAEEVRKLAEQSGAAAQQIAQLISGIQNDTGRAVEAMAKGNDAVMEGAKSVEGLSKVFEEIAALVNQVSDNVNHMSKSVKEVAGQAEGVSKDMEEIDHGAQKVADEMQSVSAATEEQSASAEEIASASDALAKLAQDVQSVLKKFKF